LLACELVHYQQQLTSVSYRTSIFADSKSKVDCERMVNAAAAASDGKWDAVTICPGEMSERCYLCSDNDVIGTAKLNAMVIDWMCACVCLGWTGGCRSDCRADAL